MRQRYTTKTNLVEHGLDRGSVVRLAVARRALRPDADELVGRVVLVLRVPPPENPALRVEQARVLVDAGDPGLDEAPRGVRARVHVALRPRVDDDGVAGFAGEEHGPVGDADGGGDVVQEDVVQDERAVEAATAREGVLDEDGRVGHDGVDDRFAAGALVRSGGAACVDLEAIRAAVDVDTCRDDLYESVEGTWNSRTYLGRSIPSSMMRRSIPGTLRFRRCRYITGNLQLGCIQVSEDK